MVTSAAKEVPPSPAPSAWTPDTALDERSGGFVSWTHFDNGPAAGTDAVLAQITVAEGSAGTVTMGIGGRSSSGDGWAPDWESDNIEFSYP